MDANRPHATRRRTVRVVANGSSAEAVTVPLPHTRDELLTSAGRALQMPASSLLDEEGEEVTDVLTQIRPGQRLFVCSRVDEPFLRERPKRCQLFKVAHAGPAALPAWEVSVPVQDAQDAALARWHEGKVIAVPETMTELRAVAAQRLDLDAEVGSIRFRSAGSGLLIFETEAVADDELLLVETPSPASVHGDVRSLLLGASISSMRWTDQADTQTAGPVAEPEARPRRRTAAAAAAAAGPAHAAASDSCGDTRDTSGDSRERLGWRSPGWSRVQHRDAQDEVDGDERRPAVGGAGRHEMRQRRKVSLLSLSSESSSCSSYSTSSLSPSVYGRDEGGEEETSDFEYSSGS
jgi:hypothetical protein